jgi:hypothetical protein
MTVSQAPVAGRYRLDRPLGSGGMGRVWLARDDLLDREVAIKEVVLPFGLTDDERAELLDRTHREARTAARLNHPSVVRVYDVIRSDDQPWIVMEYVRSRSLHQVIREDGPLPVRRVAAIGLALLSALTHAHRAGVVHRDVKPGNVLIADDGRVVLTDFGLARFEDSDMSTTRTGLILGSPQYIAPEQAREGVSTPQSDLWSLGATLYAAVEGRPPFTRPTTLSTLTALATERPDPTARAGALRPLLDGLLRRSPRNRMDAVEAERLLRRVAGGPPARGGARKVPLLLRRRREGHLPGVEARRVAAAAIMLGVTAAATVVYLFLPMPMAPGASLAGAGARLAAADRPAQTLAVPAPAPAGVSAPDAVPPGWTAYRDPAGYRVAVPTGWPLVRDGSEAYFCDVSGNRMLEISPWARSAPDLTAALRHEESRAGLAGYRRIGITAGPTPGIADWEYVYTDPRRGRMHGITRGIVVAGRAYLIEWRTPVAQWDANLANLGVVTANFEPSRHRVPAV